jgi:hypothetical protein
MIDFCSKLPPSGRPAWPESVRAVVGSQALRANRLDRLDSAQPGLENDLGE